MPSATNSFPPAPGTTRQERRRRGERQRPNAEAVRLVASVVAALLCVAVSAIHLKDQGGIPGSKDPTYIGFAFYILEVAGVIAALTLLASQARRGWLLALGVAAGPLLGYILTRGPGLPSATDDRGNWSETLGVISLVVEGTLLVVCATTISWSRRLRLTTQSST